MKPPLLKTKPAWRLGQTRCVCCGKWIAPHQEKTCPRCGKRKTVRAEQARCGDCRALLPQGDPVCPLCGARQRTVVELRAIRPDSLTAFVHLLHEGQPSLGMAECRRLCRTITRENPYRLPMDRRPGQIRPFVRAWRELGGTAAACFPWETSRRPVVLLRSYNTLRANEYARLLYAAVRKSDEPERSFGETVEMLHRVNTSAQPVRLRFATDFDGIDAWLEAWKRLGGTAVRSPEHL